MKIPKQALEKLRKQNRNWPKNHDLCVTYCGIYIDVIQRFDKTWSVKIDNERLDNAEENSDTFKSRGAALKALAKAEIKNSWTIVK